jgi:hypothetical protein
MEILLITYLLAVTPPPADFATNIARTSSSGRTSVIANCPEAIGMFIMSRGLGVVQRRLIAALQADPARVFDVEELAAIVFPGETIQRKHSVSIRRALKGLPIGIFKCRVGRAPHRGWRYRVRAIT